MYGRALATNSWISNPEFTGRTPDRAPNMVLAMVKVIRLGFSGFSIGIMNSNILCFLRFTPTLKCVLVRVRVHLPQISYLLTQLPQ